MNRFGFENLTRALARRPSRRHLLASLAGGLVASSLSQAAGAQSKRRHKRNKKKRVKRNSFGCVTVGDFCKNDNQCCSGICRGKNGTKKCQAHNSSTCQGEDACLDEINYMACTATTGAGGQCLVTTGNASYCAASARCHTCAQDADCVSICGAGAACIDCADPDCLGLGYRTACASTAANGCYTTL